MLNAIKWLGSKILAGVKFLTWHISRTVTAIVSVGGALCGITTMHGNVNGYRPGIALMVFVLGLPLGLIIFGPMFDIFIWMAIVIVVLFMMNLHNTWEVIMSLKYGGLDYIMASQAVAAAEAITPAEDDVKKLFKRVKALNLDMQRNQLRGPTFQGGILEQKDNKPNRLIPLAESY